MRKAEAAGNNDCPVKIKLVAPPLYVLTTQTLDKVSACTFLSTVNLKFIYIGSHFLSQWFNATLIYIEKKEPSEHDCDC